MSIQGPFDMSPSHVSPIPSPLDKVCNFKGQNPMLGDREEGSAGWQPPVCPVRAYLQPLLCLLPALQSQHQHLCGPLGEAQLMSLVPAVLGHVDDGAGI